MKLRINIHKNHLTQKYKQFPYNIKYTEVRHKYK